MKYWSVCIAVFLGAFPAVAGSLEPPSAAFSNGMPVAFMKTLDQVEPRIAITELPVTISRPGSYYLVSNMTGVAGCDGITIAAGSVQLDMNGFLLLGVSNSLNGIYVQAPTNETPGGMNFRAQILIRNGALENWGGWGINASNAAHSSFSVLGIFENSQGGLRSGEACSISECTAGFNSGSGIVASRSVIIQECKSLDNGGAGIVTGDGSRITSCTAVNNQNQGILTGGGTTINDCKVIQNKQSGIQADGGVRIYGCTSADNSSNGIQLTAYCIARDCLVMNNTNDGIVVFASCNIVENLAGNNGRTSGSGAGIRITGPGNRIVNNNITANNLGIVIDGNSARGNWVGDNAVVDSDKIGILTTNSAANNLVVRNAVGSDSGMPDFSILPNNQWGDIRTFNAGSFAVSNVWGNLTSKP